MTVRPTVTPERVTSGAPVRPLLEVLGYTVRFGEVLANDAVDFAVRPGEIHALVGENGAGKSTLLKLVYGVYQPDAGEIVVHGRQVTIGSPADARALGIGMVSSAGCSGPTRATSFGPTPTFGRRQADLC